MGYIADDNSFYCFVTLLSKRGVNDLTSKLLSENFSVKNVGCGLLESTNCVGIVYSVEISFDSKHHLAKEKEKLGPVRDLVLKKLDELDMKYFSCIITLASGAGWHGSNIELPADLKDMVLIKKRKKVPREKK